MSALESAAFDLTPLPRFPRIRKPADSRSVVGALPHQIRKTRRVLRELREVLELDAAEQIGFGFAYDFSWAEANLIEIQRSLLKDYMHLVRDSRTTAVLWLDIVLWFIAPFDPQNHCSQFSLQGCCRTVGADPEARRRGIVRWIAADLVKPPMRPKWKSFQWNCEHRKLDARELRERLIRNYQPTMLKRLR